MPDTAIAKQHAPAGQKPAPDSVEVRPYELALFSATYSVTGPDARQALAQRTGFSVLVHVVVVVLLVLFVKYAPKGSMLSDPMESIPFHDIVWLNQPGPGGGGGGGGNRMTAPIRKAEAVGKDKITVPTAKPEPVQVTPLPKPADTPRLRPRSTSRR